MKYFNYKNIKSNIIEYKEYQIDIFEKAKLDNSAVIMPTGSGKTIIALLMIAHFYPKKVLFLAPTKPLVEQHYNSCLKFLDVNKQSIAIINGNKRNRSSIIKHNKIIIATPQTIANDLKKNEYDINEFSLIIFDEMHKAVGNYSYVKICENYNNHVLGLTASPGHSKKRINEVINNLHIKNIIKYSLDDIKKEKNDFIKNIRVEFYVTKLPKEYITIKNVLKEKINDEINIIKKFGILTYKENKYITKKDVVYAKSIVNKRRIKKGLKFMLYKRLNKIMSLLHTIELLDTQGKEALINYLEKSEIKSKSIKNYLKKLFFVENNILNLSEHPKLNLLRRIIEENKDKKIIVFTQYRDNIDSIINKIKDLTDYRIFVGQAKKGLNQKQQKQVIDDFKKNKFNVLISTSIGEEGIDIPNVDLVVFYEPIPSGIRSIQRRGRTGRNKDGLVKILVSKNSLDEVFLKSSIKKEKAMNYIVKNLNES